MIRQDTTQDRSGNRDKCIWMQAGVVRKKECYSHYNCPECRYDMVMQNIADQNKIMMRDGEKLKGLGLPYWVWTAASCAASSGEKTKARSFAVS